MASRVSKACVPAVLLIVSVAMPARAGYIVETVLRTSAPTRHFTVKARQWIDGDRARKEILESDDPGQAPGTYAITHDGGETWVHVDPREKTYFVLDVAAMGNFLQRSVKYEVRDAFAERPSSTPGGTLVGYPTTRYQWMSRYTVDSTVGTTRSTMKHKTVTVLWNTTAVEEPGILASPRALTPPTGESAWEKLEHIHAQSPAGVTLKSETTSTVISNRGPNITVEVLFDVTSLREAEVAAERFELPSGYTRRWEFVSTSAR